MEQQVRREMKHSSHKDQRQKRTGAIKDAPSKKDEKVWPME